MPVELWFDAAEILLDAYQVHQVLMYYSSRGRSRMKRFWSLVWRLPFYWLHSGLSSRQYEAKRFISSVTFINFKAGMNLKRFYFCDNCKDTLLNLKAKPYKSISAGQWFRIWFFFSDDHLWDWMTSSRDRGDFELSTQQLMSCSVSSRDVRLRVYNDGKWITPILRSIFPRSD